MAATNSSPNADNYYSGTGIIKVMLDGEAVWRDIGNVPVLTISAEVERFEHHSSRVASRFVDFSHITSRSATLAMTLEEFSADNMALACFGDAGVAFALTGTATIGVGGTAVTAITPTTGLVVGETYHFNVPGGGADNYLTYGPAVGEGTLKSPATPGAAVAFTADRPMQINGLSAPSRTGKVRFVSTNDIGPRVQFDFPNVSFSPIGTMALLQEELGNMEIEATLQGDINGNFWRELWNITQEFNDI